MASTYMRTKWRMIHLVWQYQKELVFAAILATAMGLVLVVVMEPRVPYMNEALSPKRRWELIDEMVKEREAKWKREGRPKESDEKSNVLKQGANDDQFILHNGKRVDIKDAKNQEDLPYEEIDDLQNKKEPEFKDFEADDDWKDILDAEDWRNIEPGKEPDRPAKPKLKTPKPAPSMADNPAKPEKAANKSVIPTMKYKPYKNKIVRIEDSPFGGGSVQCTPYNVNTNISGTFDCMKLKIKPKTPICLHPDDIDIHVSRAIRQEGIWEPHMVLHFQNILYSDPKLAVIDVGANIGQYSLVAAAMNHTVLAVEPYIENLKLFHKAINIGGFQDRITVVKNAISNERTHLKLMERKDNQGGVALKDVEADRWCPEDECGPQAKTIYMDDLLEVINFDKALMKIDIEGHEHRAFVYAKKLLKEVYIPFIMMEWIKLKSYYGAEIDVSEDKDLTKQLVAFLTGEGYSAYSFVTGVKLKVGYWYAWPDDVLWKHNLADAY